MSIEKAMLVPNRSGREPLFTIAFINSYMPVYRITIWVKRLIVIKRTGNTYLTGTITIYIRDNGIIFVSSGNTNNRITDTVGIVGSTVNNEEEILPPINRFCGPVSIKVKKGTPCEP